MKRIKKTITNNIQLILIFFAIGVTIAAFYFAFKFDIVTAFGDSKGHLNIARRVFEGPTHGLAQLGAYWLPLLHLFMLPTVWNDFWWQSGLSGSIPNMIAICVTVVLIYKIVFSFTKNKTNSLLAALSLLLNPNYLYLSVTPMTEGLFVLSVVATIYFFYKWSSSNKVYYLIFAAFCAALSSLTRYEGWAVVAISTGLLLMQWIKNKFTYKWEGRLIIFSIVAWFGILLWIGWGALLVHDPFDFVNNSMSAKNQTKEAYDLIKATGVNNLPMAVLTNVFAFKHIAGFMAVSLFGVILIYYVVVNWKKVLDFRYGILLIFFAPILFDILSVYLGNVPVEVPELSLVPSPGNYFNIRYSIFSLPLMSFLIFTTTTKKIFNYIFAGIILASYIFLIFPDKKLVTLNESGVTSLGLDYSDTTTWFRNNYEGGLILASTGAADGFMYDVGNSLSNYVVEGSYKIWDNSLLNPEENVRWVLTDPTNVRDAVNKKINKDKLNKYFTIVYRQHTFLIYKRND